METGKLRREHEKVYLRLKTMDRARADAFEATVEVLALSGAVGFAFGLLATAGKSPRE
jgi:hypothetical protein